ncbi:hypothetical protein ACFQX9_16385 [Bradyrhizobium sp. GCM10028915]|uniref:hypothetical protein n=1 Tax=Bradyrhizobium sp. GCM10028915 TaxID=3273385 RepID=UPI0036148BE5
MPGKLPTLLLSGPNRRRVACTFLFMEQRLNTIESPKLPGGDGRPVAEEWLPVAVSSVAARLCLVCYGSPGGSILWLIAIHECSGLVDGCHHLGGRGLMDHVSGTSDAVQSALLAIDVQSGRLSLEVNYPVIFATMA